MLCLHVCLCTTCVLASEEAKEEGVLRCLGTRVRASQVTVRLLGPLEEQPVILTTEPFLQPFSGVCRSPYTEYRVHGCPRCEIDRPGTQVPRSHELPDAVAWNQTLVLWKRTQGFLALSVRGTDCFQNCWSPGNVELERRGSQGFSACNSFPKAPNPPSLTLGFRVQS